MKIRIFKNMCNSVFRVVLNTEDFSQDEIKLMCQFGEPEINVGIHHQDVVKSESGGDEYVRILHGFPYSRGFDTRDFDGSVDDAMSAGESWKDAVVSEIESKMEELRSKLNTLPTEEVVNV